MSFEQAHAVTAPGAPPIVVIGTTRSTFTIGGQVFNPSDGAGVIVTYDPSGAFKWIAVYGEPYSSGFPYQPMGAAVNPKNGNVSVVGINSAGQMQITTALIPPMPPELKEAIEGEKK